MSELQVLVATMQQMDFSKINEMKICSDVIFANQSNEHRYDEFEFSDYHAKMVTTNTRGVGLNRNIALDYADADILLIADDDLQYADHYEKLILEAFRKVPQADALIFNIETVGQDMGRRQNPKIKRIHLVNALNYGAVRIAVKRKKLLAANIKFSECFGGGTMYSAGEDTLFIVDMLKKGLKLYTYPLTIATVDQSESTWFNGYTHKYFYDKGALFCALTDVKTAYFLCMQDLIRHANRYNSSELSYRTMLKEMIRGTHGYGDLIPYYNVGEK